jgi:transcriptional regulator with XRE-family HTH domain
MSSSLPNYLQSHRSRLALTQDEVAFLLGFHGVGKETKISRHERFAKVPTLEKALAYEAIYGRPVRELFAGLYEQIEKEVASRAKVLTFRKDWKDNPLTEHKRKAVTNVAAKQSKPVSQAQQS